MENHCNTVLIVEDDTDLIELISEKVAENGFQHKSFTNAKSAIDWLTENSPLIMLLDYGLPDMSGFEFISDLKSKNLTVPPFIVATGRGNERVAVKMMKLGARDYIIKDVNFLEFIPLIISRVSSEIESDNKLKLAELEIKKISQHYKAIIEKSPDGFVLLNGNGNFTYASPSALRMFGYDELEIMSIQPNDLTHPDDLQMVLENLEKLFQIYDFVPVIEYRFKHKNGDWIWIESTFSNLLNDPNVVGILINFRDISERKRTEETLKLRETYLTAIIENLPGIIWLKDVESHIQLTNTKFAHTFGSEKPEDLLGKTDLDFSPKEHAVKYLADDNKVVSSKKPLHVEEPIFDQQAVKWFETFKMPIFDENKEVIGIAGYSQDITERKLSDLELAKNQKELADLFNGAPVGYHELDSEGKIVRINQTELDLLGYKKEELIGRYIWEIGINQNKTKQTVLAKLAGKAELTSSYERDVIKKDGSIIHFMVQDVYLHDATGKIIGIRSTFQDITERKISEALLKHERELYLDLVNTQPAGIYRIRVTSNEKWAENAWSKSDDSPYCMELASDRFCEIIGVSRTEFKNNPRIISDLIHPDDQIKYEIKNEEANIKQIPFSLDCRLLIKGLVKWVHFESFPRKLENGDMIFTGILYDINERIEAQSALQRNRDLLKKVLVDNKELIESSSDNIDFSKLTDVIVEISGAKYGSLNIYEPNQMDFRTVTLSGGNNIYSKAAKILGYDIKNKLWSFDPIRDEKIKDNIITKFQTLTELNGKVITDSISRLIEKSLNLGEIYIVNISKKDKRVGDFTLYFQKGTTIQNIEILELYANQVAMFVDRKHAETALKQSEETFRLMFENNPQPMFIYDLETLKILQVNQASMQHYGYSKEEFLSMTIEDIRPVEDIPLLMRQLEKIRKGLYTDKILRHKKKNGEIIHVEISSVPVISGRRKARHVLIQDVTERKKAEDALKTSLSLLHASIESTADGILVVDLDGKATLYNHKFTKMWGIPDELLESGFDEQLLRFVVTKSAYPDKFLQKMTELYKSQELTSVDDVQLADGRTFVRYSIPQKIGEKIVGRVWSFRDITHRLKIEESLKASEDKYRTMIEQSNDLIWTLDLDGNFIFANEVAVKTIGLNFEEWIGKSFIPLILPEDVSMISDIFQRLTKGESIKHELRFKKQDESILTISVNTSPIYVSGKIEGVVSFGRDITDQKTAEQALRASEELYRNLVERIPDGVYKSTPDGKFIEINPAMVQLLGYENKEELLAIDIKTELYFDPEDRQSEELDEFQQEIGIYQLKKKDGSAVWIEDHGWYMVNENNEIIYHEGVLRDITDRKAAEQALERRMDEMTRFHNLTVDRELKMIELKKEINELLKAAGEDERYVIVK
jgi:PAS domain S-box-containing protein